MVVVFLRSLILGTHFFKNNLLEICFLDKIIMGRYFKKIITQSKTTMKRVNKHNKFKVNKKY